MNSWIRTSMLVGLGVALGFGAAWWQRRLPPENGEQILPDDTRVRAVVASADENLLITIRGMAKGLSDQRQPSWQALSRLEEAYAQLLAVDLERAIALLEEFKTQPSVLAALLALLVETNQARALAWLEPRLTEVHHDVVMAVLASWASIDSESAIAYWQEHRRTFGQDKAQAITVELVRSWAEHDPAAATAAGAELGHAAHIAALSVWLAQAPEDATDWVLNQWVTTPSAATGDLYWVGKYAPNVALAAIMELPSGIPRGELLDALMDGSSLVKVTDAEQVASTLQWAMDSFAGAERQRVLENLTKQSLWYFPQESLAVIEELWDGDAKSKLAHEVTRVLGTQVPHQLADWIETQPDALGKRTVSILTSFWSQWLASDAGEALTYAQALDDGSVHHGALAELRRALARSSGDEARERLDQLEDRLGEATY